MAASGVREHEMSASRRSAAAIIGALQQAGTRLLFGLPGGGPNLDVVGAAADAGLPFVLAHGETAATIMAATYADLTGAPGAVVVTRGPGLASAVNGIAHAALDRLPLVVIADTISSQDRDRISHQRLDQAALGRAVAKEVVTLGAGNAGPAAAHAVRLALEPPAGPVVVNVDAGASGPVPPDRGPVPPGRGAGDPSRCHDLGPLAAALSAARRPVLLLGTGALPHTGAVRAAIAGSGFDYEGDTVLLNLATHRKKVGWLRKAPYATFILMNPENAYHWLSLKTRVSREISEDDPAEGARVTEQLDRIWVKYTNNDPPYGLRDPSFDERRVLFELQVVKVATFGRP